MECGHAHCTVVTGGTTWQRRRVRTNLISIDFFPEDVFWRITDVRVDKPEIVALEQRSRKRRRQLAPDGKLVILAADHPARMSTATPTDPLGMTNRPYVLGPRAAVVDG